MDEIHIPGVIFDLCDRYDLALGVVDEDGLPVVMVVGRDEEVARIIGTLRGLLHDDVKA